MGDQEFENFLHGKEDQGIPDCQKRLLYDIIQTKLGNSTDLIGIYTELMARFPNKRDYELEIKDLREISSQAFEQLDYLMSIVIDEIDDNKPESPES